MTTPDLFTDVMRENETKGWWLCNTFLLCSITENQGIKRSREGSTLPRSVRDYEWTILSLKKISYLHTCSLTVKNVYFRVYLVFLSCVTVHIYIVPLTIICMHNLKGKHVRCFLFDTFITALLYYPKCYLTSLFFFFLTQYFFKVLVRLLFCFVYRFDCPVCTVFERSPSRKLYIHFWGAVSV